MAAAPRYGQIVWAEVADANGIRKERPVIIITPDDRLTPEGPLDVVAITSRVPQPLPADHVLLPWHAQGHPRTKLNRRCAAVCSWWARIVPADIRSIGGLVPGAILLDIVKRIPADLRGSSETAPTPSEEGSPKGNNAAPEAPASESP